MFLFNDSYRTELTKPRTIFFAAQILVSEDIVRNIENTSISTEFMDTVVLGGMHDLFRIYKVA